MRLSDLMHYVMIALEDAGLTRQRDFYLTFRHVTRGLHYVEMYFVVADQRIGFTYHFSILRLKAARYPVVLSEIIELIVQSVAKAHEVPGSIDWLKTDEINEAVRSLPTRLLGKIPDEAPASTPLEQTILRRCMACGAATFAEKCPDAFCGAFTKPVETP